MTITQALVAAAQAPNRIDGQRIVVCCFSKGFDCAAQVVQLLFAKQTEFEPVRGPTSIALEAGGESGR